MPRPRSRRGPTSCRSTPASSTEDPHWSRPRRGPCARSSPRAHIAPALKSRCHGVDIPTTMPTATPASSSPMRIALTVLLDGAKGSREVFRHLAAVEHDLGRKDGQGRFLFDVPADQLKVVLRQLDGLIGGNKAV